MAVYAYIASGGAGAGLIRGTITADSARQARDKLRARGLSIREVTEQGPSKTRGAVGGYLAGRHKAKVAAFLQEMSTLLSAGIPLMESLDTIARQHTGSFQRSVLLLRDHVEAGGSLAEAMSMQGTLYDDLCVNIVEVGENSGTLGSALARLVDFKRRSAKLTNRVASALMYPAIVSSAGIALCIFLMTYVMPSLLEVIEGSGKDLPLATRVIQAISDFLIGWWWALVLGIGLVVAVVGAVLRTEAGLLRWHRILLRIPLIGELGRKQAIARMSMVMATLLKSDLVFVRAVQICQRTVRNRVLRHALEACEQAVTAGRDISVALEKTNAFPPLVIQVFAVGQASGRLDEMLEDLATDYDTQVDIAAGRLTTLLEPLMTILLAILVGFIAFATILPIMEAGDVL